ncbi:DUF3574 domain-containing protein [Burkholderia plantarii]|uniref:DUF3574 domain-containing protein n=1 Tax=Burkholderia plantarii TaxID=41899 RepID=UPI0009F6E3CD|nr:DUF3574 domain-containing protein [Burkholderia plantarii]
MPATPIQHPLPPSRSPRRPRRPAAALRGALAGLGATLWLAGCAPLPATPSAAAPPDCAGAGSQPAEQAELLFGRDIEGRGAVTDAERQAFVAEIVTPRFPDGLTLWDTQGQWRDRDTGAIVREASFVIRVVAPPTPATQRAIDEIRFAWQQRFHQQAVGLLVTRVCATF